MNAAFLDKTNFNKSTYVIRERGRHSDFTFTLLKVYNAVSKMNIYKQIGYNNFIET